MMDRQEALKILAQAGKSKEATDTLKDAVAQAQAAYRTIRANADLSEDGKRRQLAAAYTSADERLTSKLVGMASPLATTGRSDAEAVFGTKGIAGDAATLTISARDAGDRVANITSLKELRDLLTRATRTGDEVLARAIVEKAITDQDADTVHQFVADRPALDAAVERLWNAERLGREAPVFTLALVGFKPAEIGPVSAAYAATIARG